MCDKSVRANSQLDRFVIGGLKRAARVLDVGDVEITLVYTNQRRMKILNTQFRGVHTPTDVLSFAMRESEPFPSLQKSQREYLGHIVLNMNDVKKQSRYHRTTQKRVARFLAIHGFLHLVGFDHITEQDEELMRTFERVITRGDVYYEQS